MKCEIIEKLQKIALKYYNELYDKSLNNFRLECKKKTMKYLLKSGLIKKNN